ncbi:MAG: type II secretion system F family protein [Candidatus Omnitrophota bacterium]
MPLYNYKVRNKMGQEVLGSIDAAEEAEVLKTLRQSGYSLIWLQQVSSLKLKIESIFSKYQKVKTAELLFFVRQLSTLLKSGIPLAPAISSIKEQTKNRVMKEMLEKIAKEIESGVSLSDSMTKCPGIFSDYFVSMVRVGETGGILESVLDRLIQLIQQELEIRSRIKSAMAYPVILVIVSVVIITFILATIIPKFVTIFDTYGAKLPLPTKILLAVSFIVNKFWYLGLISFVIFIIWFKKYAKSVSGRKKIDTFIFKIPLFGELYLKVVISQFARTLASLLKSGVTLMEALRVTEKTVSNATLRENIQNISIGITKGKPLNELFKMTAIFPGMVVQMISVGEKTGKLEQVLFDVADFYDQEIDYAIRNMTAVLEPILLLVMGSMVAFIALSVLLPIFNLIKVFRR